MGVESLETMEGEHPGGNESGNGSEAQHVLPLAGVNDVLVLGGERSVNNSVHSCYEFISASMCRK